MKQTELTIPLSQTGWDRIHDILQDFPGMSVAELIEKVLVIAWHADNKEFA